MQDETDKERQGEQEKELVPVVRFPRQVHPGGEGRGQEAQRQTETETIDGPVGWPEAE